MQHYVGLDVSLKQTAVCVVDQRGKIKREGMVAFQSGRDRALYRCLCTTVGSRRP